MLELQIMLEFQSLKNDEKLYLIGKQSIGIIEPCIQPNYFFVTVIEDDIAEGLTRGIIKSEVLNVLKSLRFDYSSCKKIKKEKCIPQSKNVYVPRKQEWKNSILDKQEKRKYEYELYIIQAKCEGNPIKVGISGCPQARLDQLQVGCPFKLELIGTVKNADRSYEIQIHKKLSKFKLHSEWFQKEALESLTKIVQIEFIQDTNFTEEITKKYKERPTKYLLELDNVITNYMKDNRSVDRDGAINELLSMGINYHYYIKEEI